jgi:octaprenyl-diphosphate synthase
MSSSTQAADQRLADPLARAHFLLGPTMLDVESLLQSTMRSTVEMLSEISHHLIDSGGKRIRPMLLLLFEEAGRGSRRGVPLAVATEMFHSASLLHDDVVDRGHFRRGVPSAPQVFGNSASVLGGDFLLARAFGLVVDHGDLELLRQLSQVFSEMAESEVLQLVRSGRISASMPDYIKIISGKTAGLFSWCCRAGASLSGEGQHQQQAAAFGDSFGMAFQIADDILDYTASQQESGKDLANDLMQGKVTLPLLCACEEDPSLLGLVEQATKDGPNESQCHEILRRVLATNAIERSREQARQRVRQAIGCIHFLAEGPAKQCLIDLAHHVVNRTKGSS